MWKGAYGFNNYLCSEKGEIYSLLTNKIIKTCNDKNGYKQIALIKDGKKKTIKIHRLVAQTFIPNPENKPQVNHKDGNKKNNSVSNLEWCTAKENIRHAVKTGLKNDRKANNEKLNEIKKLITEGKKNIEIEKETGIPSSTISRIRHNKLYKENEREVN